MGLAPYLMEAQTLSAVELGSECLYELLFKFNLHSKGVGISRIVPRYLLQILPHDH